MQQTTFLGQNKLQDNDDNSFVLIQYIRRLYSPPPLSPPPPKKKQKKKNNNNKTTTTLNHDWHILQCQIEYLYFGPSKGLHRHFFIYIIHQKFSKLVNTFLWCEIFYYTRQLINTFLHIILLVILHVHVYETFTVSHLPNARMLNIKLNIKNNSSRKRIKNQGLSCNRLCIPMFVV